MLGAEGAGLWRCGGEFQSCWFRLCDAKTLRVKGGDAVQVRAAAAGPLRVAGLCGRGVRVWEGSKVTATV